MNRILLAGVAVVALSAMFVSPVVADKTDGNSKATPLGDALPAPDALKINDGEAEGHKRPIDVYKKAIKAAKAGDTEKLKSCIQPDYQDYADEDSWEKDGEKTLTYVQLMASILKNYSEEAVERAQGKVGDYAVIAVKNGEAANLVKVVRVGKYNEDGEMENRNWYLSSYTASDYRCDYNAPGVMSIRTAIEKGDVAKLKEHLDEYQTQALDLITGVEEGVDGYALLLKRLKKLTAVEAKPTIILNRYDSSLAYWFHTDKGDSFIVLRFQGDTYDWENDKKYTSVKVELNSTNEFHKDAGKAFKDFVQDWDW